MIKLGMIGAGGYAFYLLKLIWRLPEQIQVVGVVSNPQRKSAGRQACIDKKIPIYDSAEDMLEALKGKADVIFIPTPINTHYELTKKSVDAGFDVFLEKPPVATIQELDSLNEYTKQKNKRVAVAFQYLYSDIIQALKKRISSGEFGKIKRISSVAGWQRDDTYFNRNSWAGKIKLNGDWVLDGTINNPLAHMLSAELYLASLEQGIMENPSSVQAELYHGHDIESEDTSSVRIITQNGVEVLFNASLCVDKEINPIIRIDCEKACIDYSEFSAATINFKDGRIENIADQNIKNFEDEAELRIWMLKELVRCYKCGEEFAATLENCRPFVLAVNCAFESNGVPSPIAKKYINQFEQGDTNKKTIKEINSVLGMAFNEYKLFSEIGVEWAKCSPRYEIKNYICFPTQFKK